MRDKAGPQRFYDTMSVPEIIAQRPRIAAQAHVYIWCLTQHVDWGYEVARVRGTRKNHALDREEEVGLAAGGALRRNTEHNFEPVIGPSQPVIHSAKEVAMHRPPLAPCLSGHAAVTAKNPLSSSRWSRTCRLNRAWKCMPVRHAPARLHGAVRPMGAKRVPFRRHVRRKPPWKSSDGGSRE